MEFQTVKQKTAPASTGYKLAAKHVPVGGVFTFDGQEYVRASLKGRKSGTDFTKGIKNPCRGVRLADGAVAALNNEQVTYHPAAVYTVNG